VISFLEEKIHEVNKLNLGKVDEFFLNTRLETIFFILQLLGFKFEFSPYNFQKMKMISD
jgi:hypothetical protein